MSSHGWYIPNDSPYICFSRCTNQVLEQYRDKASAWQVMAFLLPIGNGSCGKLIYSFLSIIHSNALFAGDWNFGNRIYMPRSIPLLSVFRCEVGDLWLGTSPAANEVFMNFIFLLSLFVVHFYLERKHTPEVHLICSQSALLLTQRIIVAFMILQMFLTYLFVVLKELSPSQFETNLHILFFLILDCHSMTLNKINFFCWCDDSCHNWIAIYIIYFTRKSWLVVLL